jgi:hypothetical protein
MAAVTPVTANKCRGTHADGTENYKLYCFKGLDDSDNRTYTCATWRKFRVNCPSITAQCSSLSEAWVAAITVCNQKLY